MLPMVKQQKWEAKEASTTRRTSKALLRWRQARMVMVYPWQQTFRTVGEGREQLVVHTGCSRVSVG